MHETPLIHVTPAPDRIVNLPGSKERLPSDGRTVADASYWRRRESDGDVIISAVTAETDATDKKSKPANAKKD